MLAWVEGSVWFRISLVVGELGALLAVTLGAAMSSGLVEMGGVEVEVEVEVVIGGCGTVSLGLVQVSSFQFVSRPSPIHLPAHITAAHLLLIGTTIGLHLV